MRRAVLALALLAPATALHAEPDPRPAGPPKPPEQKEADRHFKSGVALFKQAKYVDALAEFERAYAIAPHPLVLYNIAGCHRELSHYADAVSYYSRFLADGPGKVPDPRLSAAQAELDALLALVGRVTVTITPADDATLVVDGAALDQPAMPLILAPGEHRLVARAAGRRDAEKVLRIVPGDQLTVELALAELPGAAPPAPPPIVIVQASASPGAPAERRRFALGAGFGTNLRLAGDTGAPVLGLAAELTPRLELGLDVVLVAYAVVPSVRVRVAGDALALHLIGAAPIAFNDGPMTEPFVAGAAGVGLRYRPTSTLALRLESYASFAGQAHGTTIPTFLGGELWF